MSLLSQINTNYSQVGLRAVISGVEKVGKTTLGCMAPVPLLIVLEQGYGMARVPKTPLFTQYDQVMGLLTELQQAMLAGQKPFGSLVFDSATALERLIHDKVLNMDPGYKKGNKTAVTMESALGGYGRAYQYANELFANFLMQCDWFMQSGVNIILTCHVFAAKVIDPTAGEYDTWDLLLHSPKNQKTYGKREMITQWADLIGFLHEPIIISEGASINKAIKTEQGRILGVQRTPGYVAGNRYGMQAPLPIPKEQGWNHLANALYQACGLDYFNRNI